MKIPPSIEIGGHTIPVIISSTLWDKYPDKTTFGEFCPEQYEIRLSEGMRPSVLVETFYHEVIEAIVYIYELNIKHSSIQALGAGLHQALDVDGK